MLVSNHVKDIRMVGEHGMLIEAADADCVHRLTAWVRAQPCARQLTEIIPAAETLFLLGDLKALKYLGIVIKTAHLPELDRVQTRTIVVPVKYDGMDLNDVAERTGLKLTEVVKEHSRGEHWVAFFGFSAGMALFSGVPDCLLLPRRVTPRTRVPAASVAIANEYTVIYPEGSPGGWNVIGTCAGPPLWDCSAQPPNKVNVGDRIIFEEVR